MKKMILLTIAMIFFACSKDCDHTVPECVTPTPEPEIPAFVIYADNVFVNELLEAYATIVKASETPVSSNHAHDFHQMDMAIAKWQAHNPTLIKVP